MDEKDKWKSMGLPLPEEIMNPNQDQIPEESAEISATTKDLKDTEVVPHFSFLTIQFGLFRRQVDHRE